MSKVKYLTQEEAKKFDEDLFALGFNNDQLMELAGLSCASVIENIFPASSHRRVLVICGPGNNGGDGLVCARHLCLFGYNVAIVYPKRPERMAPLLKQALCSGALELSELPSLDDLSNEYDLIVDAIFGYSFQGAIRSPFDTIIATLAKTTISVISLDIPSGWDVEKGDVNNTGFSPAALISLTAPKLCMKDYKGAHFLGGRFVPKSVEQKYELNLPQFAGSQQFARL
eukprot:TRINITY_DN4451_c3_g1_i1.p1 TRINITY_DN4451_c3_g1~~TRINITY_DN4451_c3_g1_i1.p1  ORF type:complete len:243 (-),score=41.26 TRINITY_DN4451_c3_g1_i1:80-763(-)